MAEEKKELNTSAMSFIEHIKALRDCLIYAILGISIATLMSMYWAAEIFKFLTSPLRENFINFDIIGTSPAEAFFIKLRTAFTAGILLSCPNSFYQLWRFIAPGLYANEKKIAIPFVFISSILFLAGVSFCFTTLFPYAFQYFYAEYESIGIHPSIKVDEYMTFVTRMLFVFGLVFETPVVCFFLARLGILTHTILIKNSRFGMVAIFIIAGVLTPPDVVSQLLLAGPLIVIYAVCIGICYLVAPRKSAQAQN